MTCTGVAPACATYQTPSPGWLNGAPEVTHMPPRASNATLVAYGIPEATSWPGAAIGAAPAAGAQTAAARTARSASERRTRRPYRLRERALALAQRPQPQVAVAAEAHAQPPAGEQLVLAGLQQIVDRHDVVAQLELGLRLLLAEVVDRDDRAALPVGAVREQRRRRRLDQRDLAPAELRALAAPADETLHPVQQRLRVAPLHAHV